MKATLKVPLYVLLIFLGILVVLGLLDLLHVWGSRFDPHNRQEGYVISATVVTSLRDVLPVSILATVVAVLFIIVRRSGSLPISLALAGVTAYAILIVGFAGLDRLATTLRPEFQGDSYTLPDEQLLSFPGADVYVGLGPSINLSPVVVYEWGERPGFKVYDSAVRDPLQNEILIPEARLAYPIESARQAYVSLLSAPDFLQPFFADIGVVTARLTFYRVGNALLYALSTLSLVLVFLSAWCLVRLTRWPLFNLIFVVGFVRLVFLLYSLLEGEFFRELAVAVVDPQVLAFASPALLTLLSLVLFAVAFLLPPFEEWKREMSDE